jgi:hypothetical protein
VLGHITLIAHPACRTSASSYKADAEWDRDQVFLQIGDRSNLRTSEFGNLALFPESVTSRTPPTTTPQSQAENSAGPSKNRPKTPMAKAADVADAINRLQIGIDAHVHKFNDVDTIVMCSSDPSWTQLPTISAPIKETSENGLVASDSLPPAPLADWVISLRNNRWLWSKNSRGAGIILKQAD